MDPNEDNDTTVKLISAGYEQIGAVYNFAYTGSVQTFTAKITNGYYKLEVWGAQGGSYFGIGGLGGYSYGNYKNESYQTYYVYVGGQPTTYSVGGYNGGGAGTSNTSSQVYISGGGGASDIRVGGTAYANRVIVAGGGGGGTVYLNNSTGMNGGTGGGLTSGKVYYKQGNEAITQSNNIGANQNGTYSNSDTFGFQCGTIYVTAPNIFPGSLGQGSDSSSGRGGGGGGYYGGASFWNGCLVYSGGGGSGYIGGVLNGTTTAGQRSGNGYARITYLGTSI